MTSKKDMNIKIPIQKIDENKLKQLEARLIGPSSDGNMPVEFQPLLELDVEQIRTSK